jgi:hypothetical protein
MNQNDPSSRQQSAASQQSGWSQQNGAYQQVIQQTTSADGKTATSQVWTSSAPQPQQPGATSSAQPQQPYTPQSPAQPQQPYTPQSPAQPQQPVYYDSSAFQPPAQPTFAQQPSTDAKHGGRTGVQTAALVVGILIFVVAAWGILYNIRLIGLMQPDAGSFSDDGLQQLYLTWGLGVLFDVVPGIGCLLLWQRLDRPRAIGNLVICLLEWLYIIVGFVNRIMAYNAMGTELNAEIVLSFASSLVMPIAYTIIVAMCWIATKDMAVPNGPIQQGAFGQPPAEQTFGQPPTEQTFDSQGPIEQGADHEGLIQEGRSWPWR